MSMCGDMCFNPPESSDLKSCSWSIITAVLSSGRQIQLEDRLHVIVGQRDTFYIYKCDSIKLNIADNEPKLRPAHNKPQLTLKPA